jgi:hypothetical protein
VHLNAKAIAQYAKDVTFFSLFHLGLLLSLSGGCKLGHRINGRSWSGKQRKYQIASFASLVRRDGKFFYCIQLR